MTYTPLSREDAEYLFQRYDAVYAVLDPVVCPDVMELLSACECEHVLLYEGIPPDDLIPLLPRLAQISSSSPLVSTLLGRSGEGWGIFFVPLHSGQDLYSIARHVSRLCNAVSPSGKYAWLRWYEPYVLDILLHNCSNEEHLLFYGDLIAMYVTEDDRNGSFRGYSRPRLDCSMALRLRLTPNLLEALDEGHYQLFKTELFYYCRRHFFPDASLSDNELKEYINEYCECAQQHGLTGMADMTALVELGAGTAWRCLAAPEAKAILAGRPSSPAALLRHLSAMCRKLGLLPRDV